MKFTTLFTIGLMAVLLASCSDDGPRGPMDATLSIALPSAQKKAKSMLRAEEDNKEYHPNEAVIDRVLFFVFDKTDGKLVAKADTSRTSVTAASLTEVTVRVKINPYGKGGSSDTRFDIVLIANPGKDISASTLDDLRSATTRSIVDYNPDDVGRGDIFLPMISKVYTVSGMKAGEGVANWIQSSTETVSQTEPGVDEYIEMTRLVSRVEMKTLKIAFENDYAGGTFELDSLFVVNVRDNSYFLPALDGGTVENRSAAFNRGGPASFASVDGMIDPSAPVVTQFTKSYSPSIILRDGDTYTFALKDNLICYMYENRIGSPDTNSEGYHTRMIISGFVTKLGGQKLGKRYFHVILRDTENSANTDKYVFRNNIYQVESEIIGEGSPDIDKITNYAALRFTLTVTPWKLVNQSETGGSEDPNL